MAESVIEAKITADFSNFNQQFESGVAAMQDFEYGTDALSRAYQSVSSASLQAEANQESLTSALMDSGEAAEGAQSGFAELAAGMAAGVLSAEALMEAVKKAIEFIKESSTGSAEWAESMHNLSIATGIGVENLQKLEYAARAIAPGVGIEQLQLAINRLSRATVELQSGNSATLENALQNLGLKPEDLSDSYQALLRIGDAVNQIGVANLSLQQRGSLEELLGGRGGLRLLPVITQLRQLGDQAEQTGFVMGGPVVGQLEEEQQAINRLSSSWESFKRTIGASLSGILTTSITGLDILAERSRMSASELEEADRRIEQANLDQLSAAEAQKQTQKIMGETHAAFANARGSGSVPEPVAEQETPATRTKADFNQEISDFKGAQQLIVAAAGDTAAARVAMENNIVAFLKSKEAEAASFRIDLKKEEDAATLAAAAAAKSAASEEASAEKSAGAAIMADLRRTWSEHYQIVTQAHRQEEEFMRATSEGEQQVNAAKFNLVKAQLAQELEQDKITKQQEIQLLIDAENVEYAAKMKALDDELAMLDVGTAAFATAMARRQALEIQHQTQITQTQTQGDKAASPFGNLGTDVTGQFERAFTELTTHATTAQRFLQQTFQEIANDFIHLVVQMVAESTAFAAVESGLKSMFAAVFPAASAALSSQATINELEIQQKAGVAAAAQFANVIESVPFPENLALAPSMAAAAFAQTEAFGVAGSADRGAYLSQDMPIFAHARELVLPADISDHIMASMGGGGGGDTHYHVNVNHSVSAIDAPSFNAFAKDHYDGIMEAVAHGIRQAHPAAQKFASHR
jgi:hypothetical protein